MKITTHKISESENGMNRNTTVMIKQCDEQYTIVMMNSVMNIMLQYHKQ